AGHRRGRPPQWVAGRRIRPGSRRCGIRRPPARRPNSRHCRHDGRPIVIEQHLENAFRKGRIWPLRKNQRAKATMRNCCR
ncbi:hypothetical protein HMPREF0168_0337, partial [Bifidobacterium dentium ATCC 27679]